MPLWPRVPLPPSRPHPPTCATARAGGRVGRRGLQTLPGCTAPNGTAANAVLPSHGLSNNSYCTQPKLVHRGIAQTGTPWACLRHRWNAEGDRHATGLPPWLWDTGETLRQAHHGPGQTQVGRRGGTGAPRACPPAVIKPRWVSNPPWGPRLQSLALQSRAPGPRPQRELSSCGCWALELMARLPPQEARVRRPV